MKNKLKMRWALDPYVKDQKLSDKPLVCLNLLQKNFDVEVTPTYIIGSDLVPWVSNMTPGELTKLEPIAQKALDELAQSFESPLLKKGEVDFAAGLSRKAEAQKMAELCETSKEDLVLLATHAQSGIAKLFLGSFTENLLLYCKQPMLTVAPTTEMPESFDKVFFPTDFSETDFSAFQAYLQKFAGMSKSIVLYSQIIFADSSYAPVMSQLATGWLPDHLNFDNVVKSREEDAHKWVAEAKKHNLEAKVIVDKQPGRLVDNLLKHAKDERVDLISMTTFCDRLDTILIGSATREVVRESASPVLVMHVFDH